MSWAVSARIISGESGERDLNFSGSETLLQRDRVRFSLYLIDAQQHELVDARRRQNWNPPPTMSVTGAGGQTVLVRSQGSDPLTFIYNFRWEGIKTIRFNGSPREIYYPTTSAPRGSSETFTQFDHLQLELQLRVRGVDSAGQAHASTAGGSGTRAERAREASLESEGRRRGRAEEERRAAEREHEEELEGPLRRLRESAEERRVGAVHFNFRTEAEILQMTVREAANYAERLQAALRVTPILNLSRTPQRRSPRDPRVTIWSHWDWDSTNGQVTFFQVPNAANNFPGGGAVIIPNREYERIRRETAITFAREDWIYVRLPNESRAALFQASDAATTSSLNQLIEVLDSIDIIMTVFDVLVPVARIARSTILKGIRLCARHYLTTVARRGVRAAGQRAGVRGARRAGVRGLERRAVESVPTPVQPVRPAAPSAPTPATTGVANPLTGPRHIHSGNAPGARIGGEAFESDIDGMVARVDNIFDDMANGTLPRTPPRPRPPRIPVPNIAALRTLTSQTRAAFNSIRDGFARRLGLRIGSGAQVHHAIELNVLRRYPGVFTPAEINSFSNMRGIIPERAVTGLMSARRGRRQLHNSAIRRAWNRHYAELDSILLRRMNDPNDILEMGNAEYQRVVREYLTSARDEIDHLMGQHFSEYRSGLNWTPNMTSRDLETLADLPGEVTPDLPPALRPAE